MNNFSINRKTKATKAPNLTNLLATPANETLQKWKDELGVLQYFSSSTSLRQCVEIVEELQISVQTRAMAAEFIEESFPSPLDDRTLFFIQNENDDLYVVYKDKNNNKIEIKKYHMREGFEYPESTFWGKMKAAYYKYDTCLGEIWNHPHLILCTGSTGEELQIEARVALVDNKALRDKIRDLEISLSIHSHC